MSSVLAVWLGLFLAVGGPVTRLTIQPALEKTEIHITMEGEVEYRDFTMEGPNRLILDLMGARHALPGDNFLGINRGGVRSVRTSQYSDEIVRVVVDLDDIVPYEIVEGDGSLRVILDNPFGTFTPWSTGAGDPDPVGSFVARPTPRAVPPRPQQEVPRMTVTFTNATIEEVLFTFSEVADRTIVSGPGVTGNVTAQIRDQPWDHAMEAILESQGLVAEEKDNGIIRVDDIQSLADRMSLEPLVTEAFRINYATATELQSAILALLTPERGQVSVGQATNMVIVTDIQRVVDRVRELISELDIRTPQVTISAKIIFVNRTDLHEFGVTYDLKDSQGNQLNMLTPGAIDMDGDGVIELPDEQVEVGTDVISLGGSSLAALGNANNRVAGAALTMLTTLVAGRHSLINFIEALESVNLSDVQATPTVTVTDNQQARIVVGEETPIRVLDVAAAGAAGGTVVPTASVEIKETGIILEATPHVAGDHILLELHAERSAAILAESDAGFIFQTQKATSRVLVKDGETVVIAGLTVTEVNEVRSGIPLLMNIPIIGRLFRVTRESQIQRDLMILVTPHIVRDRDN